MFFPCIFKRLSFSHEHELRAIIWSREDPNQHQIEAGSVYVKVPVDPNELIQAVHVSPTAPRWFGELVESLTRRYELTCDVVRSNLYDRPTY